MKHATMSLSLFVFIRLTRQLQKASVIHLALNKLVLGIKIQKKEVIPKRITDLFVRKRLASSENKNIHKYPMKKQE